MNPINGTITIRTLYSLQRFWKLIVCWHQHTCPPAAAPLGQATFTTRNQKSRLHSNQPRSGAPPPLPCAARRRMRNSMLTRTTPPSPAPLPGFAWSSRKGKLRPSPEILRADVYSVCARYQNWKVTSHHITAPRRWQSVRLSALSKGSVPHLGISKPWHLRNLPLNVGTSQSWWIFMYCHKVQTETPVGFLNRRKRKFVCC